ncbi:MAG: Asp-tRNA(Asn)/Glu-tRNA(Gln) amidotransferase subunit GatC [Clostridia bacterium]
MEIKKEEIMHIAKLASLKIKDEEIEEYRKNLQDILNFANTINSVDTENIEETNGTSANVNFFREDEVKNFEDENLLMQNAPEKENNMFKIPKVIN